MEGNKPQSGWQNIGRVQQWTFSSNCNLTSTEVRLYMFIAQMNIGYGKTVTEVLPYKDMAKATEICVRTIQRAMKVLIDNDYIIKVSTNEAAHIGKSAYKYKLNFKLSGFPYVDLSRDGQTTTDTMTIAASKKQISQLLQVGFNESDKAVQDEITKIENLGGKSPLDKNKGK